MELIKKEAIKSLSNPGVISRQLLNLDNSGSVRVTVTEVHIEPSAYQERHKHDKSEQIWYATKGKGKILLANNEEQEFVAGDVARFADGDIHGLLNDSDQEFVYIAVTSPPINFSYAYKEEKVQNSVQ